MLSEQKVPRTGDRKEFREPLHHPEDYRFDQLEHVSMLPSAACQNGGYAAVLERYSRLSLVRARVSLRVIRPESTSITPRLRISLRTLVTDSLVEAIMAARSWWVRRRSMVTRPSVLWPNFCANSGSRFASRTSVSRGNRHLTSSSYCTRRNSRRVISLKAARGSWRTARSTKILGTLVTLHSVTASA